jgi:hypothetical protein
VILVLREKDKWIETGMPTPAYFVVSDKSIGSVE